MRTLAAIALVLFALPSTAQLIPEDTEVEKVAEGYQFTEGPAAGPDDCIYFTDIPAELILKYDPETGETETVVENSGQANGLMFNSEGALLACRHRGRDVTTFVNVGTLEDAPDANDFFRRIPEDISTIGKFDTVPLNSPNDLDIDRDGRIYFTDPRYGNRESMQMEVEGVYFSRIEVPQGADRPIQEMERVCYRIIDDLTRPNGIVLSPDESILYVADHGTNEIFAYDIESPGEIDNKRLFARLNDGQGRGGPDGLCVDAQGRVYAAGQNRIWIYNPNGSAAGDISVGPACTNCTFANDGKTLYITANRGLYRVELNTDEPAPGSGDE